MGIYMKKIQIIEDDPVIQNELRTLLLSNGYVTVEEETTSFVNRIIPQCYWHG